MKLKIIRVLKNLKLYMNSYLGIHLNFQLILVNRCPGRCNYIESVNVFFPLVLRNYPSKTARLYEYK